MTMTAQSPVHKLILIFSIIYLSSQLTTSQVLKKNNSTLKYNNLNNFLRVERKLNKLKNSFSYAFGNLNSTNINKTEESKVFINNPCYLKGYINETLKMKGTGDFEKCYEELSKIVNPDSNSYSDSYSTQNIDNGNDIEINLQDSPNLNKLKSEKSILLGSQFKEISDYLKVGNITLKNIKEEALKVCNQGYQGYHENKNQEYKNKFSQNKNKNLIIKKDTNNKLDNICLKLTYTIILIQKLFNANDSIKIILSSNLSSNHNLLNENNLLINRSYFQLEKAPLSLLITFPILVIFYILTYILNNFVTSLIQKYFFTESTGNSIQHNEDNSLFLVSKLNLLLIESTITSLPVQNFIFNKLIEEVKIFTQKEVFFSLNEYKIFFYNMYRKHPTLRIKTEETIIKRNRLKSCIAVNVILIVFAVVLSILTTKIISYLNFENRNLCRILLVVFSLVYMSVMILECLKLISHIDNIKYLFSNNLTNYDKKFLEEEYDGLQDISIGSQN